VRLKRKEGTSLQTLTSQAPRQRSALQDVVTREYTIHLHTKIHDLAFKKSTFLSCDTDIEISS
jgi:hypothetical protein